MATDKRLTERQEKFVQNILKGMSQREAYRDAYPSCKASDKTVDENASRLLNGNPKVLARYDELASKVKEITEEEFSIEMKDILRELATIGFASPIDYCDIKEGSIVLKDLTQIESEKWGAISNIRENSSGIEIKMNDKLKALELIGRHLKMFTDKHVVEVPNGLGLTIEDKREVMQKRLKELRNSD